MTNPVATLNKYLADCGICSRRNATNLIKEGLVLVNAKTVIDPAYRVQQHDSVKYKGKLIKPRDKVYLILNKPKGFVTSLSDPVNYKTITALIKPAIKERVFPVGRLDTDTTGLILLTNDGDFAEKIAHPRYNVRKLYAAKLNRPLLHEDLLKLRRGVILSDCKAKPDKVYSLKENNKRIGIELHGGVNRVIRRMFAKLGYKVQELDRIGFSNFSKRGLAVGEWRFLNKEEIALLHTQHKTS